MKPKIAIASLAILVIGTLMAYALSQGIDGVVFGAGAAGIGAVVGYVWKGRS